ncbi:DNA polymerase III subunit chi [Pseudotabrizicola algicola]|uniref:DNA polymerase III subunit chi n=1 Tax=Pseudotabrizicola algicola TaxID=2709381 RepID=A0A6B3RGI1_9RHOB|nr:DNA polymerase III subunit chi [Pseudotabrizicola algicola]NEX45127.1 DNA polymerase III subunit chi [Pseudotabrizicola algicola]
MGIVMFYHLTQSTAEQTARVLISRAMAQGWPLMLRGTDLAELKRLDARLWTHPEQSFLPHAMAGGARDARQPLLLGTGPATNGAQGLLLIDGAGTDPAEAQAMERVWILFEAANPDRLAGARKQWKDLTAAGLPAQYWSEETGRWEKKAEKAPA